MAKLPRSIIALPKTDTALLVLVTLRVLPTNAIEFVPTDTVDAREVREYTS